jgi:hypothetical protein
VARFFEEHGMATVTLTMLPEFHRVVGIPRVAAIEYPFGRPVGNVGDRPGQRAVLLEALSVFERARGPGEVFHLPFTWPEDPRKTKWQPAEASPIIKMLMSQIKRSPRKDGESDGENP